MRLYLLRHGKAEDVPPQGERDAARALTKAGLREMRAVGRGLAALGVKVEGIATSPLLRARQTAEAVAAALLPDVADVLVVDALASGFTVVQLPEVLGALDPAASVLLVGHEPDLSELIGHLIGPGGSARVMMKRGACCYLELHTGGAGTEFPWQGKATLRWLLTARQLAALGSRQ